MNIYIYRRYKTYNEHRTFFYDVSDFAFFNLPALGSLTLTQQPVDVGPLVVRK